MKRKVFKSTISLILSFTLLVVSCFSVSASTAWNYRTYQNITYKYMCEGEVNNATASSTARVEVTNNGPALLNYIGLCASLLNTNGQTVSSTGYSFNQSITFSKSIYTTTTTPGTYTAQSETLLFNGYTSQGLYKYVSHTLNDPVTLYFYPSNSPSPVSPTNPSGIYGVTSRGETYGSAKGVDNAMDLPELISAIGINGVSGYIRNSDMLAIPYYISDNEGTLSGHFIPVYDLNGNEIDTFELTGGYTLEPSAK